jgi:MFS family permease
MGPSLRRSTPVVALATSTTVGYGVLFYAYGVLLVPMAADLGWSRTFLSGAFSAALVVSALLTVPVGRWLDRHPPRGLFIAGAVAATALVAVWSIATSRVVFAAARVLLGACQAVLFYEPAFTVLTKWFGGRERHRALTTVTLAGGLASTVFGPLTAWLERTWSWRPAVLVLGAVLCATCVPSFVVGLRRPAHVVDHEEHFADDDAVPRDVLVTRSFWLLTLAYLLNAVTTFAVGVHLVAFLVLGRGTFLRLSASRTSLHLGTWVLATKAAGLALLLAVPGVAGIVAFVVVYGSANGVATLTRATAVSELYGARHYGSISSVIASISAIGGALAPFAVAAAIDVVGSDPPVFAGLVVVSALGAVANAGVAATER